MLVNPFSVLSFVFLLVTCSLIGCNKTEFESPKQQGISEKFMPSPIGDEVHTEVYSFIKDYLLRCQRTHNISKLVQSEIEILRTKEPLKPRWAEILETEISHVLTDLCRSHPWCYQITIYSSEGVSIASSECRDGAQFNENNIYEKLGFLYPNAEHRIRTERLTRENQDHDKFGRRAQYFKIVHAIYYEKNRDYAYFLPQKTNRNPIIGYISYIIRK
jgi:hypothetical protein